MNVNITSGPIVFRTFKYFLKDVQCSNGSQEINMYSRKHSWVIVIKRKLSAIPGNICSHTQIDSAKINYQGKLFLLLIG